MAQFENLRPLSTLVAGSVPRTVHEPATRMRRASSWYWLRGSDSIPGADPSPCLPASLGRNPSQGHIPQEAKPSHHHPTAVGLRDKEQLSPHCSLLEGGIPGEPRVYHPPKSLKIISVSFLFSLVITRKFNYLLLCFIPFMLSAFSLSSKPSHYTHWTPMVSPLCLTRFCSFLGAQCKHHFL